MPRSFRALMAGLSRVNTQAEELFGYSQEELLGQKADLLTSTPRRERNVKHRFG